VLYSALEGTPADSVPLADRETIAVASDVARVLRENTDYAVQLLPAVSEVDRKLAPFPPRDWAVFNLFEGLDYRIGSDGITMDDEAPTALALETLGYRFTGADGRALALALNKASTKRILHDAGVPTPPWLVFDSVQQVTAEALRDLSFPLIVKPVAEDSSLAIDDKAVVINLDELLVRVALVTGEYHQPALVEAFIDGREINAAIWGNPPETLPLAEIDLSALGEPTRRIVSYAAKWEERTFEYAHTPAVCPALLPEELAHNIRATARCAWEQITHCRGYGRVDMRLQGETAYVLEVNPNPSIATDSGFARSARVAGLSFEQMILKILAFALEDNGVDHPSC
jgi:D-alanine-D-alanine ligase